MEHTVIHLTHADILDKVAGLKNNVFEYYSLPIGFTGSIKIYAIPRGGIPVAYALLRHVYSNGLPMFELVAEPANADIFIDDIIGTGATAKRYYEQYRKPTYALLNGSPDKWYVFPWEVGQKAEDQSATDNIVRLLQYIGEDPAREGLRETPVRVLKAWKEWTSGYGQEPGAILKTFEDGAAGYDELVIMNNIPVHAHCEHHMAPITGVAHVGYIPRGRVVGLSKLARLVDIYARRLQVQERITRQIGDALQAHLNPLGIGVVLRCEHGCMTGRGVRVHGGVPTTTSAMYGALREDRAARNEFLRLCEMAEKG